MQAGLTPYHDIGLFNRPLLKPEFLTISLAFETPFLFIVLTPKEILPVAHNVEHMTGTPGS
uniref:Uncharacterized protein n=1 Tax=Arundo donax TaxID=35708 RepID=A0A0A9H1Y7_ARUDO